MGINLVPTEISNLYNPILAEIFFSITGWFYCYWCEAFQGTALPNMLLPAFSGPLWVFVLLSANIFLLGLSVF